MVFAPPKRVLPPPAPPPPPPPPNRPGDWPGAANDEGPLLVVVAAPKRPDAEVVAGLLLDPNRLLCGCEEAVLCGPNNPPEEVLDAGLPKLNVGFDGSAIV